MEPDTSQPVRVLYFVGTGRSGTTVITSILGQVPGCFAAGELRYLWQRGVGQDHLCGCGLPFSECTTWTGVMKQVRAEGGDGADSAVGTRLLHRLRILNMPRMAVRRLLGRPPVPFHVDDVRIASLYRAIAQETGGAVIVDSSKLPTYALLLSQLPGIEMTVIHLVRDPRATAFSWRRRKESRDRHDDTALMQRQAVWKSSLLWLWWNLVAHRLWPEDNPRVLRLRYEDFVRAPRLAMDRVCAVADLPAEQVPFLSDDTVELAATHAVAGNPNRHDRGHIALRPDDEWRTSMRRRDKALVAVLTAPGLVRFGYRLRSGTGTAPSSRPVATVAHHP